MFKRIRRLLNRRERGQALAEFALLAPLLVVLVFGIVDVARAYNAWVTVQGAAREGARYGVTGRSDCDMASPSRLACIQDTAREHTRPLSTNDADVAVTVRSWGYPEYGGSAAEGDPGDQCDQLEVEVSFEFEPATPIISTFANGVTMTARERMVNEPFGPCA
jgi:hypothetical protein